MKRLLFLLFALFFSAGCNPATPAPAASAEPTATLTVPAPAAPAPVDSVGPRAFVIVPSESTASYLVNEEFLPAALGKYGIAAGKKVTVGSTQEVAGSLELDLGAEQPLGENRITVDLPSLTSDQRLRDGWIRDNALESNKYPEAVFVASAIDGAPTDYRDGQEVQFKLTGELTVRGISLPVTFDVNATLSGDTIRGVAETEVKLSDFGITPPNFANTLVVDDLFTIRIQLTAREQ